MSQKIILIEPVRDIFLREHDSYVEQAKSRILDNFKDEDIERDAKKAIEDFYRRKELEGCYGEDVDEADIAENAMEHGIEFGITLYEMKFQVILAMLALMYHQWEKKLRKFMEHELRFGYNENELENFFGKVISIACMTNLNDWGGIFERKYGFRRLMLVD